MAVFRGDIHSEALGMDTGLTVILPYDCPAEILEDPCKVLYLLHGMGDNCSAWCRYTAVERYAKEKGIAVIMPEVQHSFYCDMVYGMDYFIYITQELPSLCNRMFGISPLRENTYVAGLSMGGYGAVKCALARPDLYRGCASFSGALDIVTVLAEHGDDEKYAEEFKAILGMELKIAPDNNLMELANALSRRSKSEWPSIFVTCGTEDFLYQSNLRFKQHLETLSLPFVYEEWPGDHTWDFWDVSIQKALNFFFPHEI